MSIRSPHDCFTIKSMFYSTNTRPLPDRFSIHFLFDRYSIFFDMSKNIGKEARPMPTYPTAPDHSCRPNQTSTRPLGRA
ncbi:hypothetical protein DPMN_103340 [Dreissena polymorpha]|uniref:Uncharacterized protein n=1 Tax=Dreissena polymorpha TaxID=45954 RepID=A0A9D4HE61_DREPO|nr:hypothetical protein DPMN_103340 [Dreissena polymorpha]